MLFIHCILQQLCMLITSVVNIVTQPNCQTIFLINRINLKIVGNIFKNKSFNYIYAGPGGIQQESRR